MFKLDKYNTELKLQTNMMAIHMANSSFFKYMIYGVQNVFSPLFQIGP